MAEDDGMTAGSTLSHAIYAPRLFDGADWHEDVLVTCDAGRIAAIEPKPALLPAGTVALPDGCRLAPGFIDLQVNGGGGALLNDAPVAATVRVMLAAHRRFGTTGFLPTLITDDAGKLAALARAAPEIARIPGVLGLHLEGPFLNPTRKGIHPAAHLRRPDASDLEAIGAMAAHLPILVTLAPECVPHGVIARLVALGVTVAIGHADAHAAQVSAAVDEGARVVTHLFNAMSQMTPREPGVVGSTFDDGRLTAGIICDGVHVAPANLRTAFTVCGRDRLCLVTDAMPSVGSAASTFELQGRTITLTDGRLTAADGTLAGAQLGMMQAVRNATTMMHASLADALIMAALTPARVLGIGRERGLILPGYRADLVAFDAQFNVLATWIGGRVAD